METINVLVANVSDMKEDIAKIPKQCCAKHTIKLDLAMNMQEAHAKLSNHKGKYHGLLLGNKPPGARYNAAHMIYHLREAKGYELVPAVILTRSPQEMVYTRDDEFLERVLIIPVSELNDKVVDIIHKHFLQIEQ